MRILTTLLCFVFLPVTFATQGAPAGQTVKTPTRVTAAVTSQKPATKKNDTKAPTGKQKTAPAAAKPVIKNQSPQGAKTPPVTKKTVPSEVTSLPKTNTVVDTGRVGHSPVVDSTRSKKTVLSTTHDTSVINAHDTPTVAGLLPDSARKPDTSRVASAKMADGSADSARALLSTDSGVITSLTTLKSMSVDQSALLVGVVGNKMNSHVVVKKNRPGTLTHVWPAQLRPGRIAAMAWRIGQILLFLGTLAALVAGLIVFIRQRRESGFYMSAARLSIMDTMVQRACRRIEKQYADPGISTQSVCAALTTGEAYLEALFHKELGMSVEQFIVRVKRHHNEEQPVKE